MGYEVRGDELLHQPQIGKRKYLDECCRSTADNECSPKCDGGRHGMVSIGAHTGSNDALYSAEFLYRVGGCELIFIGPTMTITTICRRLIVV